MIDLRKFCKAVMPLMAAFTALVLTSCTTVQNNDRTISELANYMMVKTGAVWDGPFQPGPPHAESGFALRIDDRQVVFLKYNTDRKKQKKWLDYIDEHGYIYILGMKFPAMRHGSFAMLDYEAFKPKTKDMLIKTFKSF